MLILICPLVLVQIQARAQISKPSGPCPPPDILDSFYQNFLTLKRTNLDSACFYIGKIYPCNYKLNKSESSLIDKLYQRCSNRNDPKNDIIPRQREIPVYWISMLSNPTPAPAFISREAGHAFEELLSEMSFWTPVRGNLPHDYDEWFKHELTAAEFEHLNDTIDYKSSKYVQMMIMTKSDSNSNFKVAYMQYDVSTIQYAFELIQLGIIDKK